MIITPKGTPQGDIAAVQGKKAAPVARAIARFNEELAKQTPNPAQPPEAIEVAPEAPVEAAPVETTPIEAGQPDTIEAAPAETPKEEPKVDKPISAEYANLARKEKQIRARAQEMKAQEVALKAREDALKAKETQAPAVSADDLKARLAREPLSVLQELGIGWDELTNAALNQPSPDKVILQKMQAEIEQLKGLQNKTAKTFEEQQTQQYNQAVSQIRSEITNLVSVDANFETIRETGSEETVVELIKETFNKDGILMSVEDAARAVEEHLVEEYIKVARLSKIQQKLAPAPAPKTTVVDQKQPQTAKTLTNAMGTAQKLSAKDRAIAAFKGQLK